MAEIKAEEKTLSKVLSDDYLIEVPPYQRPYAWTTDEVSELLDDLRAAKERSGTDPYFLGSIVMIQTDNGKLHELIDGQQRLTTLTMLLCAARDLTPDDKDKSDIDKYVARRPNKFEGTDESPRLLIRARDRKAFSDWVQSRGGTEQVMAEASIGKNDSQRRMAENVEYIRGELQSLEHDERDAFVRFVVQQCYLVVATTTDRDAAYRMFAVLNNRGLDLSPTDILKADVIGGMSKDQQQHATDTWESYEDELGRESFRDLFQAICSIYVKGKIHKAPQTEFKASVLSAMNSNQFVDHVLEPYADAYSAITNCVYVAADGDDKVNRKINGVLRNLNTLGDYTILPPAMAYKRHMGGSADDALVFFSAWSDSRLVCRSFAQESTHASGGSPKSSRRSNELRNPALQRRRSTPNSSRSLPMSPRISSGASTGRSASTKSAGNCCCFSTGQWRMRARSTICRTARSSTCYRRRRQTIRRGSRTSPTKKSATPGLRSWRTSCFSRGARTRPRRTTNF